MAENRPADEPLPAGGQRDSHTLSAEEIAKIRKLIETDERWAWFWSGTKKVAIWVGAIGTALSMSWDLVLAALVEIIHPTVGK